MKMFRLNPEVAGEIGEDSKIIYEEEGFIKDISFLHYNFMGWLGDELLTQTPCFIITETLANNISKSELKGYRFEEIKVTKSDEFIELYPNKELPIFIRLLPLGKVVVDGNKVTEWTGDDFCLEDDIDLVVSENALKVLEKHRIVNCDIDEIHTI
jgi:hypothetical protein